MMIRWRETHDARSTSSQQSEKVKQGSYHLNSLTKNRSNAFIAILGTMRTESDVGHDITRMTQEGSSLLEESIRSSRDSRLETREWYVLCMTG